MTTRPYIECIHYPLIQLWWDGYEKKAPEKQRLSRCGIMVYKGDRPLAATWVYYTNSKMGQVGFTVTDPKAGPKAKVMAVMMALKEAERLLIVNDFKFSHSFSDSPGLSKMLVAAGYGQLSHHEFMTKELKNGT